jgi:hypothetical protein
MDLIAAANSLVAKCDAVDNTSVSLVEKMRDVGEEAVRIKDFVVAHGQFRSFINANPRLKAFGQRKLERCMKVFNDWPRLENDPQYRKTYMQKLFGNAPTGKKKSTGSLRNDVTSNLPDTRNFSDITAGDWKEIGRTFPCTFKPEETPNGSFYSFRCAQDNKIGILVTSGGSIGATVETDDEEIFEHAEFDLEEVKTELPEYLSEASAFWKKFIRFVDAYLKLSQASPKSNDRKIAISAQLDAAAKEMPEESYRMFLREISTSCRRLRRALRNDLV